jgi:hypothetical protein
MEADLQAILNPLTEHNFQNAFKRWQKHWEQCIYVARDYFMGGISFCRIHDVILLDCYNSKLIFVYVQTGFIMVGECPEICKLGLL